MMDLTNNQIPATRISECEESTEDDQVKDYGQLFQETADDESCNEPDTVKIYQTEGTPFISHASSATDLRELLIPTSSDTANLNSTGRNATSRMPNGHASSSTEVTNKSSVNNYGKLYTVHEDLVDTPMIFSRTSPVSSLASLECQDVDDTSSGESEFSRRSESQAVSPSDLPDSPGEPISHKSSSFTRRSSIPTGPPPPPPPPPVPPLPPMAATSYLSPPPELPPRGKMRPVPPPRRSLIKSSTPSTHRSPTSSTRSAPIVSRREPKYSLNYSEMPLSEMPHLPPPDGFADNSELDTPQVFKTEGTPAIFSQATSISDLSFSMYSFDIGANESNLPATPPIIPPPPLNDDTFEHSQLNRVPSADASHTAATIYSAPNSPGDRVNNDATTPLPATTLDTEVAAAATQPTQTPLTENEPLSESEYAMLQQCLDLGFKLVSESSVPLLAPTESKKLLAHPSTEPATNRSDLSPSSKLENMANLSIKINNNTINNNKNNNNNNDNNHNNNNNNNRDSTSSNGNVDRLLHNPIMDNQQFKSLSPQDNNNDNNNNSTLRRPSSSRSQRPMYLETDLDSIIGYENYAMTHASEHTNV